MLSNTWSTYKRTFRRQRSAPLKELITRNPTSLTAVVSLDIATEFEHIEEKEGMAERYITESTSSSTTLVHHRDEGASSDAVSRTNLSEYVGTVLPDTQLSTLSQEELDNLVSLVAARGVLFFENLDDLDKLALNRIVTLFDPASHDTDPKDDPGRKILNQGTSSLQAQDEWHTDASYESSPPSISLLQIEGEREDLGTTAFVSQYGVYDSLSKPLQCFLDGLTAVHSSGQRSAEHPAVRSHPLPGLKTLNITTENVHRFSELNKKESDKLLELLELQIHSSAEHIAQWKWKPGDIALWDNRCVAYFDPTSESRLSRASRLAAEDQSERERLAQLKARYNNTPLRRILARQLSKEVTPIRVSSAPDLQDETPSPADTVISLQYASEKEGIAQIKARFNNTPLRRILARQTSREINAIRSPRVPLEKKGIVSPVDSVISEQDAQEFAQSTVSEHRQKRTEEWANGIDGDSQMENTRNAPVRRSNTPLRRILERQVSAPLEKMHWD
ncbi:hypothetical protein PMIN02_000088 [Paraphaeosphaeria minitans]